MDKLNVDVGVLTYNTAHRKTYDTLCLLKAKGYENVTVYAQPLHYIKTFFPYLTHRPSPFPGMPSIQTICSNFSYTLIEGNVNDIIIPSKKILLVCGSGILPYEFVKKHIIINSHPGYLPLVRGLDSFKWSIFEKYPLGVTSYILGEDIDSGEIISREKIYIQENTTFYEAAQSVYENEISMLVEAIERIDGEHFFINPGNNILHKRMPHKLERELLKQFERYKEDYDNIIKIEY